MIYGSFPTAAAPLAASKGLNLPAPASTVSPPPLRTFTVPANSKATQK